jgi:hypothetical protein
MSDDVAETRKRGIHKRKIGEKLSAKLFVAAMK